MKTILATLGLVMAVTSLQGQTDLPPLKQIGITLSCTDNSTSLATTAYVKSCVTGGGGGTGTVTSVAATGANGIGVTGSPITSSGTLAFTLGSITPSNILSSGPVGVLGTGPGVPFQANQIVLTESGGTAFFDSTGANTTSKGSYNFRGTTSNGSTLTSFLSSDTSGNWTMLGGLTATTGSFSGAVSTGALTPSSVASSGVITQGASPVCLQSGAQCPNYFAPGGALTSANISFGSGAGTSPTLLSIAGVDASHFVAFTTGTSPSASGNIFTLTFTTSRGHTTYCVAEPQFSEYTTLNQIPSVPSAGTTSYNLLASGTALAPSFSYVFNIVCP